MLALLIPNTIAIYPSHYIYIYASYVLQVFAIEFGDFAIDLVAFSIELVPFVIEFIAFAIELVTFAVKFSRTKNGSWRKHENMVYRGFQVHCPIIIAHALKTY